MKNTYNIIEGKLEPQALKLLEGHKAKITLYKEFVTIVVNAGSYPCAEDLFEKIRNS